MSRPQAIVPLNPLTVRRRYRKALRYGLDDLPSATDVSDLVCGDSCSTYRTPSQVVDDEGARAVVTLARVRFADMREFGRFFRRELARRVGARRDGRTTIDGLDYARIHWAALKALGLVAEPETGEL